jgi:predicted metal-binding transcription factor (methanogenesis marker protein 9)
MSKKEITKQHSMKNKSKSVSEVRSDYTDEQNYIHIDVWFTDEDDEGQTVAIVCADTKKVFFIDNIFRNNSAILEEISEVLKSLEHSIVSSNVILEEYLQIIASYKIDENEDDEEIIEDHNRIQKAISNYKSYKATKEDMDILKHQVSCIKSEL